MALPDGIKNAGTVATTVAVFVLVGAWSIVVWQNLGKLPEYNDDGTVRIDQFQRAKDILTLLLPLATIAVGYWLGSEGKAKADEKAKTAEAQVKTAENETLNTKADAQDALFQNAALMQAAREKDPAILQRAKELYPSEAFE